MSEKIFCVAPKYLDEFKCDGSQCGAMCCRNEWAIFVDAATYKKYSLLPRDEAREILRYLRGEPSGEKFFIKHDGVYCPFLGADNLCRIQKAHGESYLSQVCASYPRIITRFENFLEIALSPTCPVAAKLFLIKTEPLQFKIFEASEKILRLGECHILQGVPRDFAPLIFDAQLAMASILQERRLSLDGRLIVLGFFLDRIEELLYGGKLDGAALKRLATIYTSEKFFLSEVPFMLTSVRFNAAAYENFMRKISAEIFDMPGECAQKIPPAEFATIAENFLVNEIFLSTWPFRLDESIVRNFGVFVTVYKIFERLCLNARGVDDILSAANKISHKVNHDGECLTKISALLGDDMLRLTSLLLNA